MAAVRTNRPTGPSVEHATPFHGHGDGAHAFSSQSVVISGLVLFLLVVAYLVPGLVGHDPWKPDEPYTFGVVRNMLASRDWVVPFVGGLPFVEKPPLFYWVASVIMQLASPLMPLHDAARLTTGFFVLVSLASVAAASRLCWGEGSAGLAILLFIATLGLEGHAQRLQVDLALMAGFSVAVLGFAGIARDRAWSGVTLGLGIGIGFLSKGLLAPGLIGMTALLLPLLFPSWRSRRYLEQLSYAAAVALPALVIWPVALWLRDPALFNEWFWRNNVGRFLGFSALKLGATSEPYFWPQTLPWFLFPLWIYVVAAVRREGRRAWHHAGTQIGLTLSVVASGVLLASASGRAIYALPLLPAMVLAGVAALRGPEGTFARLFGFVSIAIGAVAAVLIWVVWSCLVLSGRIPAWTQLPQHFPVPFEMPFDAPLVAAALALTAGFAALVALRRRLVAPSLTLWVGAISLSWGLAMTLWLPWIDAAKSYREVFTAASEQLPKSAGCLLMSGPGESERAMAEYFMGIAARSRGVHEEQCAAILWMNHGKHGPVLPGDGWQLVWSGHRRGERVERFELFERRAAR